MQLSVLPAKKILLLCMDVKTTAIYIVLNNNGSPCYASMLHVYAFFFTELAGEDINDEAERMVNA